MGFSPTISVTILYAPWVDWREANAKEQYEQLQADENIQHVELVECERAPIWENSKRCWSAALDYDSTHHLHTLGDAILCENFGEAVVNAIRKVPNQPLCFHQRQKRLTKYYENGHNWALHAEGTWGIGTTLPKPYIEDFLEFGERYYTEDFGSYDRRLAGWAMYEYGRPVWVTLPSLIQHIGGESVLGNDIPHEQRSDIYVDELGIDAREIDWSFSASELPEVSGEDRINKYSQNFRIDRLIEDGYVQEVQP